MSQEMAGYGERPVLHRQNAGAQSGHLLASLGGSRLQTVFRSLRPLVYGEDTFRSYARSLLPGSLPARPSTNLLQYLPNQRTNILTQNMDLQMGDRNQLQNSDTTGSVNSNASTQAASVHQNVVINIETDNIDMTETVQALVEPNSEESVDVNDALNSNEQNGTGSSFRINGEPITEILERHQELRSLLMSLLHYCIFIVILFVKLLFDKFTSILIILCLIAGFCWSDNAVRKASTFQDRSPKSILLVLLVIPVAIFLVYHYLCADNFFYSALLLFPDWELLNFGDFLWVILVTDYILKLVTVLLKAFIVMLHPKFLKYSNRGRQLVIIEMFSQFYRSMATIQPWLSYLLDGYSGPWKVFGVFLSASYLLCKGPELLKKGNNLRAAIQKLLSNTGYGSTPTQEQLDNEGGRCSICHDDFQLPMRLQCTHIFCEQCVLKWFNRERTCPMCRKEVADNPVYRDGTTSQFIQLY